MKFRDEVITLIQAGVKPALGCTEPGAVALAAAYAGQALGTEIPTKVEVSVDSNVYKNGVAVGIPGTGKVGLAIAAALGSLIKDPALELSVLSRITPELLTMADTMLAGDKVDIRLNEHQGLHIEVKVSGVTSSARAVIDGSHTNLILLERDGKTLSCKAAAAAAKSVAIMNNAEVTLAGIIAAVEEMPGDEFSFFSESIRMNRAAAQAGLNGRLGMAIGANFQDMINEKILTDDLVLYAKILTAAAADARMSGENVPVMSVAGSGNHGLTAILPVVAVAERLNVPQEKLHRALAISALTTLYIKTYTGSLSALCGCAVAAATGASAAIVWMLGGSREQIDGTIKNMIANLTGMICDGGKVGCALKLSTAAGVAVETALLTLKNVLVPDSNGIIFQSTDDSIRNLGMVSSPGMLETDKVILEIMLEKSKTPAVA